MQTIACHLTKFLKMKILFCSYRDWARPVYYSISRHPRVEKADWVSSTSKLETMLGFEYVPVIDSSDHHLSQTRKHDYDLVVLCGWSEPPCEAIVKSGVNIISEHPARNDRYSPGTPLQNQILDGLRVTKHRIVKVGYPELSERKWSHEIDMNLSGNMDDILNQMTSTSITLFDMFLDEYPSVMWKVWDKVPDNQQVPRRTPEMSKILSADFNNLNTKELYDRIRCLESPYPNAYIEDEHGKLFFEKVSYTAKT